MAQTGGKALDFKFSSYAVAYLDVLGFRSLIVEAEGAGPQSVDSREKLHSLISEIDDHVSFDNLSLAQNIPGAMRPQYFFASDSVIVVAPTECEGFSGLVVVGLKAIQITQKLLTLGFLVRGAISVGPLLLRASNIFGSAFMEAYHVGEYVALYPRVLLTKAAVTLHSESTHMRHQVSQLNLWTRFDDKLILDILSQSLLREFCIYGGLERAFDGYRQIIEENIAASPIWSSRYQKWAWMARFYNQAMARQGINTVPRVGEPSKALRLLGVARDVLSNGFCRERS